MQKFIISILIAILLTSCGSNPYYQKSKTFENNTWARFDILSFDFPVKIKNNFDFYLAFSHTNKYLYSFIDVNITILTPDGEVRSREYHYRLKNTKLNWKGDKSGDTWNIKLPIRKDFLFNKSGTCKIKIENKMQKFKTLGIVKAGLVVKKSSSELH